MSNVMEIWESKPPGILRATPGLLRDSFSFFFNLVPSESLQWLAYGLGDPEFVVRIQAQAIYYPIFHSIQTGLGNHLVSYTNNMGTSVLGDRAVEA